MNNPTAPLATDHRAVLDSGPRRSRRTGRVVTAAVALVLTGGVAVSALGAMTAERETHDVVVEDALTSVVMRGGVGDVSVRSDPDATRTTVQITTVGGWSPVQASAVAEGGALQLRSSCGRVWPGPCSAAFEVTVPEGLDLDLSTGTGDQDLVGTFGAVRFDSDTGDVSWTASRGTSLTGRVDTGNVQVQGAVPAVRVTGETGAVRLALDAAPTEVQATTATGDVRILVPDDGTRYDATATSDTGGARIAVPTAAAPAPRLVAVTETGVAVIEVR